MSVQVQNWSANAAYVVSSLDEHAQLLVQGLLAHNATLAPEQQIDEATILAFVRWMAVVLAHKTNTMVAAEMAYIDEQADDPAVRQRRDQAMPPLALCLARTRNNVRDVLGDAGLATYALSEAVPRPAAELSDYARVTHALLLKYPRQEPDGIGGTFDTAVIASALALAHAPLDEALRDLRIEQRQLEGAMLNRDSETSGWREFYVNGATTFASLYRIAGHPGLAARVRPTARRIEGRDPEPGDETPDDGTGDPEAPADPETPPTVES